MAKTAGAAGRRTAGEAAGGGEQPLARGDKRIPYKNDAELKYFRDNYSTTTNVFTVYKEPTRRQLDNIIQKLTQVSGQYGGPRPVRVVQKHAGYEIHFDQDIPRRAGTEMLNALSDGNMWGRIRHLEFGSVGGGRVLHLYGRELPRYSSEGGWNDLPAGSRLNSKPSNLP